MYIFHIQIANLFTTGSSSVVGLFCGGYDMSAAVYLVIKVNILVLFPCFPDKMFLTSFLIIFITYKITSYTLPCEHIS